MSLSGKARTGFKIKLISHLSESEWCEIDLDFGMSLSGVSAAHDTHAYCIISKEVYGGH